MAKGFPQAPLVEKPYQVEALMEALRRALAAARRLRAACHFNITCRAGSVRWTLSSTRATNCSGMMMVLSTGLRIALGQPILSVPFVIDGADVLAVRAEDFHVFLDLLSLSVHNAPPCARG